MYAIVEKISQNEGKVTTRNYTDDPLPEGNSHFIVIPVNEFPFPENNGKAPELWYDFKTAVLFYKYIDPQQEPFEKRLATIEEENVGLKSQNFEMKQAIADLTMTLAAIDGRITEGGERS